MSEKSSTTTLPTMREKKCILIFCFNQFRKKGGSYFSCIIVWPFALLPEVVNNSNTSTCKQWAQKSILYQVRCWFQCQGSSECVDPWSPWSPLVVKQLEGETSRKTCCVLSDYNGEQQRVLLNISKRAVLRIDWNVVFLDTDCVNIDKSHNDGPLHRLCQHYGQNDWAGSIAHDHTAEELAWLCVAGPNFNAPTTHRQINSEYPSLSWPSSINAGTCVVILVGVGPVCGCSFSQITSREPATYAPRYRRGFEAWTHTRRECSAS